MKSREEFKELSGLSEAQLASKLSEVEQNLLRLRFKLTQGQLQQTSQITGLRKTIARIKTAASQLRISADQSA
jgi:large subunit ribosomal protein L29